MIGRAGLLSVLCLGGVVSSAIGLAAPSEIAGGAIATVSAVRGEQNQVGDGPVEPPPPEPDTARYRVTLHIVWTPATHPGTIPPSDRNPHVSPPVLATHRATNDVFERGTLASDGLESVAETGATATLVAEMSSNANVTGVSVGQSIFGAGAKSFDVELSQDANMVSLVTMLAPSPDWFVGVNSIPTFVDGVWRPTYESDLSAYDAGTDSAPGFVHSNSNTVPAQPIGGPVDTEFANADAEGRFGFVTITRLP